jgi:hypothetical protein
MNITQPTGHKILFALLCLVSAVVLLTAASALGSGRKLTLAAGENAGHALCTLVAKPNPACLFESLR